VPLSPALLDRAIRFVSENHRVSHHQLARHVFGGEAFAPLLDSLQDERLTFDGSYWSLREVSEDWAVVEILASGPNPARHRIIEVAACRGEHRFQALITSGKRVPKLLQRMGVPAQSADDDVEAPSLDWRPLDVAAAELQQFLGGTTVVGFSYLPAFLERLLGPVYPAIDLLELLYRTTYFAGRPDPSTLARHFGLPAPLSRRPGAMLPFTAALFERLRGQHSLAGLRNLASPEAPGKPRLPDLPHGPGVYVMARDNGPPLYVGKSVDLRNRVSSYIGRPIAESRGLYHLTHLANRVEVVPVDSEVEALMLEARLITEWQPAFNVQRKVGPRCRYLRLSTNEPFPRITACPEPAADGATYFGPFHHATAALRLRVLLGSVLRLRTCPRRLPPARKPRPACAKAAAETCLAPCQIGPPLASYDREMGLARDLLSAPPERFRQLLLGILRERPPDTAAARKLRRVLGTLSQRA
jgi:hypothetical protein